MSSCLRIPLTVFKQAFRKSLQIVTSLARYTKFLQVLWRFCRAKPLAIVLIATSRVMSTFFWEHISSVCIQFCPSSVQMHIWRLTGQHTCYSILKTEYMSHNHNLLVGYFMHQPQEREWLPCCWEYYSHSLAKEEGRLVESLEWHTIGHIFCHDSLISTTSAVKIGMISRPRFLM